MKRLQFPKRLITKYRSFCEEAKDTDNKIEPTIMVHGGAGAIFDDLVIPKIEGVKSAAQLGYKVLLQGSALDAVEQAIRFMDNSECFNSGKGSLLNMNGEVEMDAIFMSGDLRIGAVSCVQNIQHPISLSRIIMEKSPYILLTAEGAMEFAKKSGIEILKPGALVTERAKEMLKHHRKHGGREMGVVGAVALDKNGNLAAGTSSGGVNNKLPGRACCCLTGCSTFADNMTGAIAVTGDGESIIKACCAYTIMDYIEHGLTPSEAIQKGLFLMDMRLHTTGGGIAISSKGDIGCYFNTKRMPWAYQIGNTLHFGIEKGEHNTEQK